MGLFDAVQGKNVQADDAGTEFDSQIRELKAQKIRIIRQIGEEFVKENEGKDMSGTKYQGFFSELKQTDKDLDLTEKKQLATRGLRKCESCGAELPIKSGFCNKCGAKQGELESEVAKSGGICPHCGAPLDPADGFCAACGHKL